MKRKLLDYIKKLSLEDKKGLLGKALKTSEEVGELAKAILPYEDSPGTLHRFSNDEKILDSVADVMLSAISIAYQLGYDHNDIEYMLGKKSQKWAGIQHNESKMKSLTPFEIHVTVEKIVTHTRMLDQFVAACKKLNVKPIIIELEKNDMMVMQDVMTSSVHFGTNNSAWKESERIRKELVSEGFDVARVKIETVPWHPMAPKSIEDKMPVDCYFESHLRVVTTAKERDYLQNLTKIWGAHLSRNYFKKLNNDQYIIMVTLRNNNVWLERFEQEVDSVLNGLRQAGFEVDKKEIEFAVYDSKVNHDAVWLK